MKVGFLGLGQMGAGIAANILKAGHDLVVWNRSPEKAEPLVRNGAVMARTPREAANGREIVLTMLADDGALEAVLSGDDGLIAGLAANAMHASVSTIAVATADAVAARHARHGQRFDSGVARVPAGPTSRRRASCLSSPPAMTPTSPRLNPCSRP